MLRGGGFARDNVLAHTRKETKRVAHGRHCGVRTHARTHVLNHLQLELRVALRGINDHDVNLPTGTKQLYCIGLDWIGLGCTRVLYCMVWYWTGLDWTGLDWIVLYCIGLYWIGLDWIGLEWIELNWTGLD